MGPARPAYGHGARVVLLTARLLASATSLSIALAGASLVGACSRTVETAPLESPSRPGSGSARALEIPGQAPAPSDRAEVQRGYASWYGASLAGHRTASGERFDPRQMTAAHRTLPLGTWVEVRRQDGSAPPVRVRINDRGPFGHSDRIIDLARAAAEKLGMRKSGVALVEIRVVGGP